MGDGGGGWADLKHKGVGREEGGGEEGVPGQDRPSPGEGGLAGRLGEQGGGKEGRCSKTLTG